MLIGTQNGIIFITSLGASIINLFFSFNLTVILSKRLNRILDMNLISSKKAFFIRIFNLTLYFVFIFGTVYLIQWSTTSIGSYFRWFIYSENPTLINLILSTIPYPFTLCYLIASIFLSRVLVIHFWNAILIGISLFLIIIYLTYKKSVKSVKNNVNLESYNYGSKKFSKSNSIRIKINSPLKAFIIKDLKSISRDFKTFLSSIIPLILNSVFIVYLNVSKIQSSGSFESSFILIWMGTFVIIPLVCGILILSVSELGSSGKSILDSLPIIQRDRAKSKLILMITILTISDLLPTLFFINTNSFFLIFQVQLLNLPISLILLVVIFEIKVFIFGKRNYNYLVRDVVSGKFLSKFIVLFIIPYGISLFLIITSNTIYWYFGFNGYILFITLFLLMAILVASSVFKLLFPKKSEEDSYKRIQEPHLDKNKNLLMNNISLAIFIVILLNILFFIIHYFAIRVIPLPTPEFEDPIGFRYSEIFILKLFGTYIVLFLLTNLFLGFLYFYLIPKITDYLGQRSFEAYLNKIGLNGMIKLFKSYKVILISIPIMVLVYFYINQIISGYYLMDIYNLMISFLPYVYFIFSIWGEILMRGIIFNLLLEKYRQRSSLFLLSVISILYFFFSLIFIDVEYLSLGYADISEDSGKVISLFILYYVVYNIVLNYSIVKAKSLYPIFLIIFILLLFNLPTWIGIYGFDFLRYIIQTLNSM